MFTVTPLLNNHTLEGLIRRILEKEGTNNGYFIIEQITIPYEKKLLTKWKVRNSSVVQSFMLVWNGPGFSASFAVWIPTI